MLNVFFDTSFLVSLFLLPFLFLFCYLLLRPTTQSVLIKMTTAVEDPSRFEELPTESPQPSTSKQHDSLPVTGSSESEVDAALVM